jgi:cytochrome c553
VKSAPGSRFGATEALVAAALASCLLVPSGSGAQPPPGQERAQTCTACHGLAGNSVDPAVPSLAGQQRQFIAMQLVMYREGHRKSPQMTPVAANMSNAHVNEIAGFFSSQKPALPTRTTAPDRVAAGRRLAAQHHCVSCHGADFLGQQHVPRLAGQHFEYLRATLRGFKAATRFDMDGQMTSAAQLLSEEDIEILADYLSGLR